MTWGYLNERPLVVVCVLSQSKAVAWRESGGKDPDIEFDKKVDGPLPLLAWDPRGQGTEDRCQLCTHGEGGGY